MLLLPCAACDVVVVNAIFLVASDAFATTPYRDILQAHFGPATIDSVQPDTITGAEVRSTYFPNRTDIYQFQLLHITRVRASITTANTTAQIQKLLPAMCAGIGPVAIVSESPTSASSLLDAALALFPPIIAPIALGGWLLTILLCGACWLVFLCTKPTIIPAAVTAQSVGQSCQYEESRTAPGPAAVRLVLSSAGQAWTRP